MTVIETSAGLLLYSPVRLTSETIAKLRSIDHIVAIVAPNLFHHMFLRPCIAAFPGARALIAQGLQAKIGVVPGAEEITAQTNFGAPDEFFHFVFNGHSLQETILFHRPTATLITADLIYNYGPRQYPVERAFFRTIGCYGAPKVAFYHRFSIRNKKSVRLLIDTVSSWPVRRIIMSHGDIIEGHDAALLFASEWERFTA